MLRHPQPGSGRSTLFEYRDSGQRCATRDTRRSYRERRRAGDLHRAHEPPRAGEQPVQGTCLAGSSRHAGRLRGYRTRPHGISARRRHRQHTDGRYCRGHGAHRALSGRGHPPARQPGRRHSRAGDQGSDRHQGRAPHDIRRSTFPLSRLHATGRRHRRLHANRRRGRATEIEERDSRVVGPGADRRLHPAHGRAGRVGREPARGHGLSRQALASRSGAGDANASRARSFTRIFRSPCVCCATSSLVE